MQRVWEPALHKMIGTKEHTFFFSSTEIALASLRNIAFPQRSSRSEVNWWNFHFLNAHAANWYSRSLQLHSASNKGLTEMPSGNHSQTTTQSMTQRKEINVLNIAQKYLNEISVLRRWTNGLVWVHAFGPTNTPTNWCNLLNSRRALLEHLTVILLLKIFPAFYGTQRFMIVFTGVHSQLGLHFWLQVISMSLADQLPINFILSLTMFPKN